MVAAAEGGARLSSSLQTVTIVVMLHSGQASFCVDFDDDDDVDDKHGLRWTDRQIPPTAVYDDYDDDSDDCGRQATDRPTSKAGTAVHTINTIA
ncbi:unnamed protein product [Soboliphyme baturini]|uniref:Secreted protein n=1 Tax=Soboliphyme baturini TaxID=241478 RepID=A0A183IM49_9BILA|nr:unnamed protein product [Soboliphyme baturini]